MTMSKWDAFIGSQLEVRAAIGGVLAGPAGVASVAVLTVGLLAVDVLLDKIREEACTT
jgi:hypothetical protein